VFKFHAQLLEDNRETPLEDTAMALEHEMEVFARQLPELLGDPGNRDKYALVHGDAVDSIWPSMDEAIEAGYNRFGLSPFLVKEITDDEKPKFFSRNINRCPSSPAG
jgi:hypothetical protein